MDFPPGWGNRTVADRAFAAAGLDPVPFEVTEFPLGREPGPQRPGYRLHPAVGGRPHRPGRDRAGRPGALRWRVSLATPTARRLSAAARAFAAELLP